MKTKLLIICIFVAISGVLLCLFIPKSYEENEPKKPQLITDLCFGDSKEGTSLVYVKENEEYVADIVIETENCGEDAVLLMRKDAYFKEMMYRDENSYGKGGAYYNGCNVDVFLEKEFYDFFSGGMKLIIRDTPVKIHTYNYVSKRKSNGDSPLETIYRHVFVLSRPECSSYVDVPYEFEDTDEGAVIPAVHENPIKYYTWLRSERLGGDDTHVSLCYNGGVTGSHIQSWEEHYLRPVFTVLNNEQIEKKKIYDNSPEEEFVFVADK